ncbi:MAG: SAM-dependent methyltransferase [Nannocystaceae bacterium]|nr:SAM-dependent methyltransferase [Nannocystaceae bacterium]
MGVWCGRLVTTPKRDVHHGDGIAWLREARLGPEHAIVTSVPDLSEMQPMGLQAWRDLAVEITRLACLRAAPQAVVILYQTDIKVDGRTIDKSYLAMRGAEEAGVHCLWHKVVCRTQPGNTTFGRPAFGHWMAFSRELRLAPDASTPDVLPELGVMTWARAMPMSAARATCEFLLAHTECRVVVDPFCGLGTILAVANEYGLDAIGVELSAKRARKAGRLTTRDGVADSGDSKPT